MVEGLGGIRIANRGQRTKIVTNPEIAEKDLELHCSRKLEQHFYPEAEDRRIRHILICNKCESFFFKNKDKKVVWSMMGFRSHSECWNHTTYEFGSLEEGEEILGFGIGFTPLEYYEQLRASKELQDQVRAKLNFVWIPSILVWTPPSFTGFKSGEH